MDIDEDVFSSIQDLLSASPDGDAGQVRYRDDFCHLEGVALETFSSQLERLLAGVRSDDPLISSKTCEPCLPGLKGNPFTVKEIQGKGLGVLASRRISPGEIILDDPFAISIQEPTQNPATDEEASTVFRLSLLQLVHQYIHLPTESRRQLASLHAHVEPSSYEWFRAYLGHAGAKVDEADLEFIVRLYFTFVTNEFSKVMPGSRGTGRLRRLFLTTSRINHSCLANAKSTQTTDGHKVVTALNEIEEGEEITLKYLNHHYYNRRQWQDATQRMWGFVCSCSGCSSKT